MLLHFYKINVVLLISLLFLLPWICNTNNVKHFKRLKRQYKESKESSENRAGGGSGECAKVCGIAEETKNGTGTEDSSDEGEISIDNSGCSFSLSLPGSQQVSLHLCGI